jgi:hypothetical protein
MDHRLWKASYSLVAVYGQARCGRVELLFPVFLLMCMRCPPRRSWLLHVWRHTILYLVIPLNQYTVPPTHQLHVFYAAYVIRIIDRLITSSDYQT